MIRLFKPNSVSNFFQKFILDDMQNNIHLIEMLKPYLKYLKHTLKNKNMPYPLVIFDVDGTLLEFGTNLSIQPVVDFYHQVKKLGYHTVVLTARTNQMKSITIKSLKKYGIDDYDQIIFRPSIDMDAAQYKLAERKKLATSYEIVANVGDRMSDFYGGYNGKIVKI
jgi:phosphoglycolate phosphatase-like HAD superfamily hydrolase